MGYKNRALEYENDRNNLKGWELLVKFSDEFNNLIINNKLRNKNYIELLISQMNGKFLCSLKSNQLTNKNTKYNRVWNQCIYGLENILKKSESQIKYNLLSHHTKQLVYVGRLNLNKNI